MQNLLRLMQPNAFQFQKVYPLLMLLAYAKPISQFGVICSSTKRLFQAIISLFMVGQVALAQLQYKLGSQLGYQVFCYLCDSY